MQVIWPFELRMEEKERVRDLVNTIDILHSRKKLHSSGGFRVLALMIRRPSESYLDD